MDEYHVVILRLRLGPGLGFTGVHDSSLARKNPARERSIDVPGTDMAKRAADSMAMDGPAQYGAAMLTAPIRIDPQVAARVDRLGLPFNRYGVDPYGIDKRELSKFFTALNWIYRGYFKVDVYGINNLPAEGAAMIVGNHSGGVAIDGAMVIASAFFEMEPPRLAQAMVDKFLLQIPGASQLSSRLGHFAGLPEHAVRLLGDGRLVAVFPEGARGTAKLARDAHTLVGFGTGFMRLALQTGAPIVPIAFLGGGDAMPTVTNLYRAGRLFGLPYIPVTKYLVPLPRPTRFQLLVSEPMYFRGSGDEADAEVAAMVAEVRRRILWLLEQGEALRAGTLDPSELELGGQSEFVQEFHQ